MGAVMGTSPAKSSVQQVSTGFFAPAFPVSSSLPVCRFKVCTGLFPHVGAIGAFTSLFLPLKYRESCPRLRASVPQGAVAAVQSLHVGVWLLASGAAARGALESIIIRSAFVQVITTRRFQATLIAPRNQ